jgi:hypothetical protein
MLIPDNIHPDQTIYFNAAFVLKTINQQQSADVVDLYMRAAQERPMTIPVFMLCLDWLYLLGLVESNSYGKVILCS